MNVLRSLLPQLFTKVEPVTLAFVLIALVAYFVALHMGASELAKTLLAVLGIAIAAICKSLFGRAPAPADLPPLPDTAYAPDAKPLPSREDAS